MLHPRWLAAFILGAIACRPESATVVDPPLSRSFSPPTLAAPEQTRLERTARRVALALRNPALRHQIRSSLAASRFREHKLELQQLLRGNGRQLLTAVARESGDSETQVDADLNASGSLEIYLPLPNQRLEWNGTDDILVATALRDGDTPVAFDIRGRRQLLDRTTPPAGPVLAVLPAETDFTVDPARATCLPETCPAGGGGGVPPAPRGIWLTQTSIYDLHEDWLRGSPEVEAMFMGPLTDTTKMNMIACANESASGLRYYDQDRSAWTGNVLVADSMQLERVRAAYPPGTPWRLVRFTVAFWEDDTGRCQIASSSSFWGQKLAMVAQVVLGGMAVLGTDWTQPIDDEAWPIIVQLPLGLVGLLGTIGGSDDFIGSVVNRTAWNPLHPNDQVYTTQVILDGKVRNGSATLVWR
jgi:hypothetical protein